MAVHALCSRVLFVICCIHAVNLTSSTSPLSVTVDDKGNYKVEVESVLWLRSAPTFFNVGGRTYSTKDGLLLSNITTEKGIDSLGYYNQKSFHYQFEKLSQQLQVIVKFKWYRDRSLVLLGQHFMSDFEKTSVGDRNAVTSGFPSFLVDDAKSASRNNELGYLAFGGIMNGDTRKALGIWNNHSVSNIASGLDSGPLVLFSHNAQKAVVISTFSNFMASSVQYAKNGNQMAASWGVLGMANHIPADFAIWTSVFYSDQGINRALEEWGNTLRLYYDRDTSYTRSDFANNYLGYWTDNGAYYYYKTEGDLNYQDTIVAVKEYADKQNIPYRYVQYDSWWYPKGPERGVTEWVSMMSVFPNGLRYLWEKTGWAVVAHNRFWSDKTVYAKRNGGKYNFIIEPKTSKAIPTDQQFWNDLMMESKKWGLITYEQDWLNKEFDEMNATVSDVTLGRKWLRQMGTGAQSNGITLQYCMAPSRHALASLEIPVVTQTRVSNDYQPGNEQWRIGISSIFAHALGLAPFKDNFWTTSVQPGNVYNLSEPFPGLQAAVATLSTGPVGPSDRIGYSNPKLIMRSCNTDGLLLKPSVPARAIDKQIIMAAYHGFKGEVWSTYSSISGLLFGIILGADFKDGVSLTPLDAGFGEKFPASRVFRYGDSSRTLVDFFDTKPLVLSDCSKSAFCLAYSTPIISLTNHEVLILGEMDKWVPMSPQRVSGITMENNDIQLTLNGAVTESVTLTFVVDGKMKDITCAMDESGSAVLSLLQVRCL